jgi:hypothetical protein
VDPSEKFKRRKIEHFRELACANELAFAALVSLKECGVADWAKFFGCSSSWYMSYAHVQKFRKNALMKKL